MFKLLSFHGITIKRYVCSYVHHFRSQSKMQHRLTETLTIALIITLIAAAITRKTTPEEELLEYIENARKYSKDGEFHASLRQYNLAISSRPDHYLLYYERAHVYLNLKNTKAALRDFDRALDLRPNFVEAFRDKARIYTESGDYERAGREFKNILNLFPYNQDAQNMILDLEEHKRLTDEANVLFKNADYHNASRLITQLLKFSPLSANIYKLRYEINEQNSSKEAISDLQMLSRLTENNDEHLKLAELWYDKGFAEYSQRSIRSCLESDPEHRGCLRFYKNHKKIFKVLLEARENFKLQRYEKCIASAKIASSLEPDNRFIAYEAQRLTCACSRYHDRWEAIRACSKVLYLIADPTNFCDRAEAYLDVEYFYYAKTDFQRALELDATLERAKRGLNRCRDLTVDGLKEFLKLAAVTYVPLAIFLVVRSKKQRINDNLKEVIKEIDNLF